MAASTAAPAGRFVGLLALGTILLLLWRGNHFLARPGTRPGAGADHRRPTGCRRRPGANRPRRPGLPHADSRPPAAARKPGTLPRPDARVAPGSPPSQRAAAQRRRLWPGRRQRLRSALTPSATSRSSTAWLARRRARPPTATWCSLTRSRPRSSLLACRYVPRSLLTGDGLELLFDDGVKVRCAAPAHAPTSRRRARRARPPSGGCNHSPAPTRVTVDLEGGTAGTLVLLDSFYPGWQARVDGVKTAVSRSTTFRGCGRRGPAVSSSTTGPARLAWASISAPAALAGVVCVAVSGWVARTGGPASLSHRASWPHAHAEAGQRIIVGAKQPAAIRSHRHKVRLAGCLVPTNPGLGKGRGRPGWAAHRRKMNIYIMISGCQPTCRGGHGGQARRPATATPDLRAFAGRGLPAAPARGRSRNGPVEHVE